MDTVIAVIVIVAIVALAAFYVYKAKKSGKKCIGCPDGGSCNGKCTCCCGCEEETEEIVDR